MVSWQTRLQEEKKEFHRKSIGQFDPTTLSRMVCMYTGYHEAL